MVLGSRLSQDRLCGPAPKFEWQPRRLLVDWLQRLLSAVDGRQDALGIGVHTKGLEQGGHRRRTALPFWIPALDRRLPDRGSLWAHCMR